MKTITTKFHGPSNVKGSRYSATDGDKNRVIPTCVYCVFIAKSRAAAAK